MTSCISLHGSREFPCACIGMRTMDGHKGRTRPIVVGHDDHDAAVRLLRTSLSCIVQHFVLPYVADAGSFCRSSHPHITLRCCSMTDVEGGQPPVRMRHCICSILSMQPVTGQFQTSFGTQKRKDGKLNALAFQVEIVSSNRRRIYQASLHRRLPERPLSARRAVFRCNRKTNRSALANTLPNAFHGTSPR